MKRLENTTYSEQLDTTFLVKGKTS